MKNKLELFDTVEGWVAVFSGTTGEGEVVTEDEAHNIEGATSDERIQNALIVWGADRDSTEINFY